MPLQTYLSVHLKALESASGESQNSVCQHLFDAFIALNLDDGTGTGQADRVFSDRRNLSASASENLDLAGSLAGAFGQTVTFVKVKLIILYCRTAGQTLSLSKGASNGWGGFASGSTDALYAKGGGFLVWFDPTGTAVTASTGDIVTIANSSGSTASYDIFVIGTSA